MFTNFQNNNEYAAYVAKCFLNNCKPEKSLFSLDLNLCYELSEIKEHWNSWPLDVQHARKEAFFEKVGALDTYTDLQLLLETEFEEFSVYIEECMYKLNEKQRVQGISRDDLLVRFQNAKSEKLRRQISNIFSDVLLSIDPTNVPQWVITQLQKGPSNIYPLEFAPYWENLARRLAGENVQV